MSSVRKASHAIAPSYLKTLRSPIVKNHMIKVTLFTGINDN